jgi:hypothetical protein
MLLRPVDVWRPTLTELIPTHGGWLGPSAASIYYGVLAYLLAQHQHLKVLALKVSELGPHMTEMLKVLTSSGLGCSM